MNLNTVPPLSGQLSSIKATCRHRHCHGLSTTTAALPHMSILADYVPKFPRIGDTPKDFIAPDVPLLPGFNADDLTRLFLPDLINTDTIYTFLLCISLAIAVVYLEIGALFNDFIQEKEMEKLEEQFLQDQDNRRRGIKINKTLNQGDIDQVAVDRVPLLPEKLATRERKRGLGWLAFTTAAAIWCTGILNKINPFQP